MKAFIHFLFGLCAVSTVFAASSAHAEPTRESAVQLHLDAAAGISTAGAVVSALGLVRVGLVEVGGSCASSGLFSTRTGGGLAVGAGGHRPGGGGWDVLLEGGVNEQHVSGGLLTSDPGASGAIPYGGLRAGIDWSFGNAASAVHPTLGLWLFARMDLEGRAASYTYENRDWFSSSGGSQTGSAMLGGGGELGITLAGGLDLLP